jgi:hypothetical protein
MTARSNSSATLQRRRNARRTMRLNSHIISYGQPAITPHAFVPDRWLRCTACGAPRSVAFHVTTTQEVSR